MFPRPFFKFFGNITNCNVSSLYIDWSFKMSDGFAQVLSFVIGVAFFFFYIVIAGSIFNNDVLGFPYIILTIYFFISIFTFPNVSLEAGGKTSGSEPLSSKYTLIFAYLVSPIWFLIKLIKNKGKE